MADDETPEARPVVLYRGTEYQILQDLTEREKFDAERLSGKSLDEMGNYTAALLCAYFTLRRAGHSLTFDEFLDVSGFEFTNETPVPLDSPAGSVSDVSPGVDLTEIGGIRP